MFKLISPLSIASAFASLIFLGATPAMARSPVTFISGKGVDSGTCALPSASCRTFQFALGQTSAGGEIKALDPASYGSLTINKSISVTGVEGAGIFQDVRQGGQDAAITIDAAPNDVIYLSHLILDGFKTASNGIVFLTGGSLTISYCTVRNFVINGIGFFPIGTSRFLIRDTLVSDNVIGINVTAQNVGSAQGTLEHVLITRNSTFGLKIFNPQTDTVRVINSIAANNVGTGFFTGHGGLLLAHSAATANGVGVNFGASAGNNFIRGNGTEVSGTLTNVGTR